MAGRVLNDLTHSKTLACYFNDIKFESTSRKAVTGKTTGVNLSINMSGKYT
jgi:hypothetical protein